MLKHIVFFKTDSSQLTEELADILLSMKGNIDELKYIEVGIDINRSERAFDLVLITEFDDLDGLNSYSIHPYHTNITKWVRENGIISKVVDYTRS